MGEKRINLETLAPSLEDEVQRELKSNILSGHHKDWEMMQVPVEFVIPNPNQPRKEFDEVTISELAQSIEENGLIEPLVVRPLENGKFELLAGERRLRALKLLGRAKAPVVINNSKDPLLLGIIENIQREDLSPIDLAEALQRLKVMHAMRDEDIAKVLGKGRSWVNETLAINKLRPEEKQHAKENNLNRSALIEMARGARPTVPGEAGKAGHTVRDLRAQRKGVEPAKNFRFHYRSEIHQFNVTVVFDKTKVTKEQIRAALKEASASTRAEEKKA